MKRLLGDCRGRSVFRVVKSELPKSQVGSIFKQSQKQRSYDRAAGDNRLLRQNVADDVAGFLFQPDAARNCQS